MMHRLIETTVYSQAGYSAPGARYARWLCLRRLAGSRCSPVCWSDFLASSGFAVHGALGYPSSVAPNSYCRFRLTCDSSSIDSVQVPFIDSYLSIASCVSTLSPIACSSTSKTRLFARTFEFLCMTPMTTVQLVSRGLISA